MKIKEAEAITHTLSKPGKMPGFAYSTPAHECKTGTKLRAVAGSVCANCYAYERGRYRFQNVIDAQYKRFRSLTHPKWVEAMASQINSNVLNRIALAFPVFKIDKLDNVNPTFSESSLSDIFRFAIITSKLTIIAINYTVKSFSS